MLLAAFYAARYNACFFIVSVNRHEKRACQKQTLEPVPNYLLLSLLHISDMAHFCTGYDPVHVSCGADSRT